MMRGIIPAVIACVCALPATVFAQGEETKTITGEVVGLKCYMDNAKPDVECTRSALAAGEPAGILEDTTGTLYIAVSGDNTVNEAKQLLSVAGKKVEVKGSVTERGGIRTISVQSCGEKSTNTAAGAGTGTANATPALPPGE